MTYALVGNPNCGKTTVFNALTGLRQKVGNYPGVTVEWKEGECTSPRGERLRLIDLPGAYSLNARSPDEAVLLDVLLGRRSDTPRPDRIICILDASNLERNLYLATHILELGLPTILVLNMIDVAEEKGLKIDFPALEKQFGSVIIPMQANTQKGLVELKFAMDREDLPTPTKIDLRLPQTLNDALQAGYQSLNKAGVIQHKELTAESLCLLSQHDPGHHGITDTQWPAIVAARKILEAQAPAWEDQLVSARYDWIHEHCESSVRRPGAAKASATDLFDAVLLHPLWGWATVTVILGILFYLIFSLAEGPMSWIEDGFAAAGQTVQKIMPPGDLRDLITKGIIAGVGSVVVFLPQILILFFFIGLMEDTGYMARVAFIMDRLMSKVGLNGKSFLPLLSSYACAVPGVMATRTIDNPKDRLITILVVPLASCSARLPVYLLMIATMIPAEHVPVTTKVGLMVLMYFLGTFGAFVFAWIFNRSIMKGENSLMILELPSYKTPSFKGIAIQLWERSRIFIRRAGTIILGISILLWAAATYPKSDSPDPSVQLSESLAGKIGRGIEPLIAPLGYDWKMGIGLLASFAAREVFVSTMSIVYSVEKSEDEETQPLRDRLLVEVKPDGQPRYTPLVCLSLMVFYVFAMQCMSTVAIVKRETNGWKWPLFQLGYMTVAAYVAALLVFQIGSALGY
ncbi:MAG: Fe(2+) transporter FeoB [Verrucomicrobia subdivision 3 bacterium]|nr:Fe(2+) transporter FeoB [Limisphaerales bacterium]MCS1416182.1 Fe(2+) transporter FeoB [Limisphaerales bacterium]